MINDSCVGMRLLCIYSLDNVVDDGANDDCEYGYPSPAVGAVRLHLERMTYCYEPLAADSQREINRHHLRHTRERVDVSHDFRINAELVVEQVAGVSVNSWQAVD